MLYYRFIIIATSELDKRINIQFSVDELVSKGIDVEFWNVSPITYNIHIDSKIIEGVRYFTFNSKKEFYEKVKEYDKSNYLYLVYMNYTPATYFCFRELSKYNCRIVYCLNGIVPIPQRSKLEKIKTYNLKNAFMARCYRLLFKTPLLKPISYQLNTCLMTTPDYKTSADTKQIPFKTTDVVLSQEYEDDIVGTPYYVFVDQYLPFHSDMNATKAKSINPDTYYRQLNSFFSKLEKQTGLEVVIAAHPVAEKYKSEDFFEGRKVYFLKTPTLIKHSKGVINHFSTAISYTVLYAKPSVVLISDDIASTWPMLCGNTKYRASLLGVDVINIDHIPESPVRMILNEGLQKTYKENYLMAPNTGEESNAEMIISIMNGQYE